MLYDPSTDSLYVTLGNGRVHDTVFDDERDLAIEIDANGKVLGYDLQHASRHPDVIAEAMILLQGR
ncbi:hypothetical protein SAE02_77510 [Skermanella aerolata]|uniref:DUF2283 domain-containing protein n=1 Tax=Skermanella aerolata TaxID=393310 RepID=A0A512E4J5_9PROT|nr:DUF2283 domain-containing protein [Skermanella aerolata]GEO43603.1 hypothetical protein SAE02_77510 [Skermanella aerolata]